MAGIEKALRLVYELDDVNQFYYILGLNIYYLKYRETNKYYDFHSNIDSGIEICKFYNSKKLLNILNKIKKKEINL